MSQPEPVNRLNLCGREVFKHQDQPEYKNREAICYLEMRESECWTCGRSMPLVEIDCSSGEYSGVLICADCLRELAAELEATIGGKQ